MWAIIGIVGYDAFWEPWSFFHFKTFRIFGENKMETPGTSENFLSKIITANKVTIKWLQVQQSLQVS
jgi:hypothetical protein